MAIKDEDQRGDLLRDSLLEELVVPSPPSGMLGEVLFSRIPVRSENDYCGILKDILDLQQAKELSEDILRHSSNPHGKAAGYIWER